MVKKTNDILSEKRSKLEQLTAYANNAVDVVTRTINDLEHVNKEIDDTVSEIESYAANLLETRDALNKNRRHNAAVIANFSRLLNVNEDET